MARELRRVALRPLRLSAGIGFASERSQTAEADAQHAAREISKELATFFVEQGWITQDAANKLFWDD